MSYLLLLPDNLTPRDHKLLNAALTSQRVPQPTTTVTGQWDERLASDIPLVLSVGKGALDLWHQFGLIKVGHNHGDVFRHRGEGGRAWDVMVVAHPGSMDQLAFVGHKAREDYAKDLLRWRMLLEGKHHPDHLASLICGGCLKMKDAKIRTAQHWVEALDCVGLCEDHYRKRAQYARKRKKRIDPSKPAAQIAGQGEMFADGQRVMVSKR